MTIIKLKEFHRDFFKDDKYTNRNICRVDNHIVPNNHINVYAYEIIIFFVLYYKQLVKPYKGC